MRVYEHPENLTEIEEVSDHEFVDMVHIEGGTINSLLQNQSK